MPKTKDAVLQKRIDLFRRISLFIVPSLAVAIVGLTGSLGFSNPSVHCSLGLFLFCFLTGICGEAMLRRVGFAIRPLTSLLLLGASALFALAVVLKAAWVFSGGTLIALCVFFVAVRALDMMSWRRTAEARFAIVVCALGVVFLFLYALTNMYSFSPDSYAYYGIAESFFDSFGDTGLIRQYSVDTELNISFPYLYPLFIFIVDVITELGLYAGVLFNLAIAIMTSLAFFYYSEKLCGSLWCGGLASFVLLTCPAYLDEVCAARAIPLALFFTFLCIATLAKFAIGKSRRNWCCFLAGLMAGSCACVRFDGLSLVGFCFLAVIVFSKGGRIRGAFLYGVGALIPMAPWIAYSLINFGTFWIADNAGTFLLVETLSPRNVNASGAAATLLNSPSEWWGVLPDKIARVTNSLIQCSYSGDICILVLLGLLLWEGRKRQKEPSNAQRAVLCMVVLFYLAKTVLYILVGYRDIRYHTETVVLLVFFLALYTEWTSGVVLSAGKFVVALVICAICYIGCGAWTFFDATKQMSANPLASVSRMPDWIEDVDGKLDQAGISEETPILVLQSSDSFYGWTMRKTYVAPLVPTEETIREVLLRYPVQYVLVKKDDQGVLPSDLLDEQTVPLDLGEFVLLSVR